MVLHGVFGLIGLIYVNLKLHVRIVFGLTTQFHFPFYFWFVNLYFCFFPLGQSG